jgi:hypothetical protein
MFMVTLLAPDPNMGLKKGRASRSRMASPRSRSLDALPLIMIQPEDNLDNAFIAERIVTQLRSAQTERQFLFAMHNANIPVIGDAEWIGILSSSESHAEMPVESLGSIDLPAIRERVVEIPVFRFRSSNRFAQRILELRK